MIKVHIRRKVSPQKRDKLQVLINKLRALTMGQPGYIAGETLKRVDTNGILEAMGGEHATRGDPGSD
jgi:antibiotic biosynthesis monooxygenase (ABM) superfamily enzyme